MGGYRFFFLNNFQTICILISHANEFVFNLIPLCPVEGWGVGNVVCNILVTIVFIVQMAAINFFKQKKAFTKNAKS